MEKKQVLGAQAYDLQGLAQPQAVTEDLEMRA